MHSSKDCVQKTFFGRSLFFTSKVYGEKNGAETLRFTPYYPQSVISPL